MVSKNSYLDLTLVPLSLLFPLLYHCWLWRAVRSRPHQTYIGMSTVGQRAWFHAMLKDNDKKNVLAVQTLRNNIMGSTLMANAAVLTCCGLLTFAAKIHDAEKPRSAFSLGDNGELHVESKFAALLMSYLSVFFCHSLSVACLAQVSMVVNALAAEPSPPISRAHVLKLLDKGLFLCTMGNRLFFSTLPLMLWIFGPVLVFVSSIGIVSVMYSVDIIDEDDVHAVVVVESKKENEQNIEP